MKRFRAIHNGIISDNYYQSEIEKNTCIYFNGFPATLGNNLLTDELIKRELLVIQPHFPGTYDSEGEFTPQNSIEMVAKITNSINNGNSINVKNNTTVDFFDFKYAVGNSFGCFIALKSLKYLPKIKKLFLFAPAITYGESIYRSGFKESGLNFLDYVKRSRPYTYRFGKKKDWEEFYAGKLNDTLENPCCEELEEVICVVGLKDTSFDLELLKKNYSTIINQNVGRKILSKLIIVENGKHSISTLINNEVRTELDKME